MNDYSFLEFVKPEYVDIENVKRQFKYDNSASVWILNGLYDRGFINVRDYKELLRDLIFRHQNQITIEKDYLERAEKYKEDFDTMKHLLPKQNCCCSDYFPCKDQKDERDYSEL